MQKTTRALAVALLLILVITSCNLPSGEDKTGATETALVQTVAAGITQTAAAKPSPSATTTQMPTLMLPTASSGVNSGLPTLPALPTSAPSVKVCNQASFVADVTIPDGAKIAPSTSFKKTWRLQNTGTCTWDANYQIVFVSGNMTGPDSTQLTTGSVAPGASVDVTVTITSPAANNTYYSYFRLKATDGTEFGISQNPSGAFYVQIVVTSTTLTVTPTGQATITSFSPSTALVGGTDFVMTVTGTNFFSGSVVYWSGTALATTYVSATSLKATVLSAYLTNAGTANMTVKNTNGTVSPVVTYTVASSSSLPTITNINPASATVGGGDFIMSITGTNFVSGSVVWWSGTQLATTYVNATSLKATVLSKYLVSAGTTANMTVHNPNGTVSAVVGFNINAASNPAPTLNNINPASTTAGNAGFTLTVTGASFVNGAIIYWNGGALSTSYNSASQLSASVPAGLTAGTYSVAVVNPAPGGGSSGVINFTVNAPNYQPNVNAVSPDSATAGSADTNVTISGSNFISGAVVTFNGNQVAQASFSDTSITVTIPASLLTTAGTYPIIVANPTGDSESIDFTVN